MVLPGPRLATAAAVLKGLFNVATGRGEHNPVELRVGDRAPEFELPGSDGQIYRLADVLRRGAVVLAWFPKAFTGGCTSECRSLGVHRDLLMGFQAQYFAASVDAPDTNRRFARSLGVEYPILSDESGSVARAYGVVGPSGFPRRWTFFIGPGDAGEADGADGVHGRILAIDKQVRPSTHGSDVAARLTELHVPRRA
jgi:thioredoxin-dependent peroxiredoxin